MLEISDAKSFNTIESYIVRRIETLEEGMDVLTKQLVKMKEERDAYRDDVAFLAELFECKNDTYGTPVYMTKGIYKRFDTMEFDKIAEIKGEEYEHGDTEEN